MTVKKALDLLVSEGLSSENAAKVHLSSLVARLSENSSFQNVILKGSRKFLRDSHSTVESKIIHFKLEFASEFLAEKLQSAGAKSIFTTFTAFALSTVKPYVLEQTYMSTSVIPGITEEVLLNSIYQYIEGPLGLRIASATKILRAAPSSEDEQKYLQLLPTEPVFEVEQVGLPR